MYNQLALVESNSGIQELSLDEQIKIHGGVKPHVFVVAAYAAWEFGKSVGESLYNLLN